MSKEGISRWKFLRRNSKERTAQESKERIYRLVAKELGIPRGQVTSQGIDDPGVSPVALGLSQPLDLDRLSPDARVSAFPKTRMLRALPSRRDVFVFLGNMEISSSSVALTPVRRVGEAVNTIRLTNVSSNDSQRLLRQGYNGAYGATVVSITELPTGYSREYKGEVIGTFYRRTSFQRRV